MSKLQSLSILLRNEQLWPEGFEWDYSDVTRCAVGLARATGMLSTMDYQQPAYAFGLTHRDYERIFYTPLDKPKVHDIAAREAGYQRVTPQRVACRIDRYLKKQAMAA